MYEAQFPWLQPSWINHWLMTFNHELREIKKHQLPNNTSESQIPFWKIPCFFSTWRNSEGFFDFFLWGNHEAKSHHNWLTKLPLPSYSSWIPVSYQKARPRKKLSGWAQQGADARWKRYFFWDCNKNSFNEIVFVKVKDDKAKTWMTRKQISWSWKTW